MTATAIRENDQFVGLAIKIVTDCRPPMWQTVTGQCGHIHRSTDRDRSGIVPHVGEPVWHSNTVSIRTNVMILHAFGVLTPLATRIVQSAHPLFLLGVNTHEGTVFGHCVRSSLSEQ